MSAGVVESWTMPVPNSTIPSGAIAAEEGSPLSAPEPGELSCLARKEYWIAPERPDVRSPEAAGYREKERLRRTFQGHEPPRLKLLAPRMSPRNSWSVAQRHGAKKGPLWSERLEQRLSK